MTSWYFSYSSSISASITLVHFRDAAQSIVALNKLPLLSRGMLPAAQHARKRNWQPVDLHFKHKGKCRLFCMMHITTRVHLFQLCKYTKETKKIGTTTERRFCDIISFLLVPSTYLVSGNQRSPTHPVDIFQPKRTEEKMKRSLPVHLHAARTKTN